MLGKRLQYFRVEQRLPLRATYNTRRVREQTHNLLTAAQELKNARPESPTTGFG